MLALQQKTIDSLLRIREQHLLQPAAHEPPPPPFKAPEPDFGAPNESQIHGEMIMNGPLANDIKKRRGVSSSIQFPDRPDSFTDEMRIASCTAGSLP